MRLQSFTMNNLRERRQTMQGYHVSVGQKLWGTAMEIQTCRAGVGEKDRKEIWIKGNRLLCVSGGLSDCCTLKRGNGRLKTLEWRKKNQWLSDFLIWRFFHMAPALSAFFECYIPLRQPLPSLPTVPSLMPSFLSRSPSLFLPNDWAAGRRYEGGIFSSYKHIKQSRKRLKC